MRPSSRSSTRSIQLLVGLGRNAVEGRLIAVEHRDRHPFTGRHGGHRVLFVFRDAYGGLGQHAVRHLGARPAQDRIRGRVSGLGFGLPTAAIRTDQGRSNQAVKLPSVEKPCEKFSPIATGPHRGPRCRGFPGRGWPAGGYRAGPRPCHGRHRRLHWRKRVRRPVPSAGAFADACGLGRGRRRRGDDDGPVQGRQVDIVGGARQSRPSAGRRSRKPSATRAA